MKKLSAICLCLVTLTCWAQSPLLKAVEIPYDATNPPLRTEGLLTSHWTQDYPYNTLCPKDPANDYTYSYAGCPAVAMGQIINYWRTTQGTRFTDSDDYVHNYPGRVYYIDDDWETLQFPSFPQLNELLDSVDATFQRNEELPDLLAAAVIFACGTACTQVYSSEGSGTFAVDQAFAAYQRFGFTDCQLFREADSAMYATLISNIQAGYIWPLRIRKGRLATMSWSMATAKWTANSISTSAMAALWTTGTTFQTPISITV
ncbi:MAG: C10 family peptidase [Bacteroidales bacterium]|nr:C10 family peptidase [Bacteroidales bacterium]